MTIAQLNASRKLWRAREISRYKKWHFYRYSSKRPAAERAALRDKWYKLYIEARDARRDRDREIAKARKASAHEVSDAGVALVAEFEGFRANAYHDAVGVLTQGYGETQGVTPGRPWTEAYAKQRLRTRLNKNYLPAVLAAGKGKLNQDAVDGFTSASYNLGPGVFAAGTSMGNALRAGKVATAANALLAYVRAGGRTLPGLAARRRKERALILKSN